MLFVFNEILNYHDTLSKDSNYCSTQTESKGTIWEHENSLACKSTLFLFCSQIFVLNQLKIVFPFLPSTVITIITAHCFTQLLTFKWQVIARHQNLLVAILIQPIAFGLESISFCLNSDFTLGFNSNSTNHSY